MPRHYLDFLGGENTLIDSRGGIDVVSCAPDSAQTAGAAGAL